jgi:quinol monooxygenase YgiN
MSAPLILLFEATVNEGQFEAFKDVATKLVALTKTESGAQVYEWFVSDDKRTVLVAERYESSEAILAHGKTFETHAPEMLALCQIVRILILGEATAELKAAMPDVQFLNSFDGFRR